VQLAEYQDYSITKTKDKPLSPNSTSAALSINKIKQMHFAGFQKIA